ncbi:hypothetical protein ELY33_14755 [Vreelandella andesensis]|uniref:Sulfotransferase domain-containing protein n=1 Tax=Vreelandella andesensis TaxID=447567 RepID=A0A3S0XYU1_9GAMM|nr:hypothetical protein [Halomonas andesensis]RUR27849.1 hypothetical protein ELY33_14755 [Halomonas andesensis]
MHYDVWLFFGLQRSGNHAVINWLAGLSPDDLLIFNNVRPGGPLLKNRSGVSFPTEVKAYAERIDGKIVINEEYVDFFKSIGGRLLVSSENYPVRRFNEESILNPIVSVFGPPQKCLKLFVLRNPINMLPSAEKMLWKEMKYKKENDDWVYSTLKKRLSNWKSYAFLTSNPSSITRGEFFPVIFDRWVKDREYRDALAKSLGFINRDKNVDFVSDAGKGSSFSGLEIDERESVLQRWNESSDFCREIIKNDSEVLDYIASIFGESSLPDFFRS